MFVSRITAPARSKMRCLYIMMVIYACGMILCAGLFPFRLYGLYTECGPNFVVDECPYPNVTAICVYRVPTPSTADLGSRKNCVCSYYSQKFNTKITQEFDATSGWKGTLFTIWIIIGSSCLGIPILWSMFCDTAMSLGDVEIGYTDHMIETEVWSRAKGHHA